MENVIDLNSSEMSTASAISPIGLESTMTEEFLELKAFQVEVAHQVEKVVEYFGRVKDFVIDELQNGSGQTLIKLETFDEERHAAVEMLSDYYSRMAVVVRENVNEKLRRRVKKIHRFINLMKIKLSTTKEMAADQDDVFFLAERDASFPLAMIPAGSLDFPVASTPAKVTDPEKNGEN